MLTTLTLLFGGWFLYQKLGIDEPIREQIGQMKSVKLADLSTDREQIVIRLTVTNPDAFPEEYQQLLKTIERIAPGKKVELVTTNQDGELKKIWNKGIFAFTEALELRQYSKIPAMLADWKAKYGLDAAISDMDDEHLYVFLKRGEAEYFTIVSREQPEREVTANG